MSSDWHWDTGKVLVFRHEYQLRYNDGKRTIIPAITYPYGEEPLDLALNNQAIHRLAAAENEDALTFFVVTDQGPRLASFTKQTSFLG